MDPIQTFILSIQKVTFPISTFIILGTDLARFNPSTAPHNSSLGIFVDFRGATRDFDITILEVIYSLFWIQRVYVTASYAFSEASAKTCSIQEPLSPDGTKHLGTLICSSSCKFWDHFNASSLQSSLNFSCQFIPDIQTFCISTFALVIYGTRNPSGSKSDDIFLSKLRFAKLKFASIGTIWYVNWSSFASQSNPSVFN